MPEWQWLELKEFHRDYVVARIWQFTCRVYIDASASTRHTRDVVEGLRQRTP